MRSDIRNIAIIAHVDHGKTTIVDAMLKQSHVFRQNQQVGDLIMDSNDLEREKGITILSKNTAITYKGVKINVIDTPGHVDFSGEVERVLNMADGCLLIVDAVDGPMPQTRFVLRRALQLGLRPIAVINKIDRPSARPEVVAEMIQDLFLELATDASQLDFPILYAAAKSGYAIASLGDDPSSIEPLFEAILKYIPGPEGDPEGGFQMLVTALLYDSHLGQIVVGRILRGRVAPGDRMVRLKGDDAELFKVTKVFVFQSLARDEVELAEAGEIVAIAGLHNASISDTIAGAEFPEALAPIDIGEPTVQMTFGVNDSPFAGREGRYVMSRQIRARLINELQTNVSLRVTDTESADEFLVAGRGELHLSILIETMRREGYEFRVSRPQAIIKTIEGKRMEPYERLTVEVAQEAIGAVTESLASRLARMTDMRNDGSSLTRIEFVLPTRGLIGFRSHFLKVTRGEGVMNSEFLDYRPLRGEVRDTRTGALVAAGLGTAVAYGLNNAQQRGQTFIDPGTEVYEGMIVGVHAREQDLVVNVCKEKKMTNVRAASADTAIRLTPPVQMSLEEALNFIAADEVIEITPLSMRLRKRVLGSNARHRSSKAGARAAATA